MGGRVSVLPDLLVAPGAGEGAAEKLVERMTAGGCDVADFHGLPADSRIAAALGPRLGLVERIEAPVLDLTPGWDEVYRAKTTSKKRNLHRRRRRQLGELGSLSVDVARELDELEPAWRRRSGCTRCAGTAGRTVVVTVPSSPSWRRRRR